MKGTRENQCVVGVIVLWEEARATAAVGAQAALLARRVIKHKQAIARGANGGPIKGHVYFFSIKNGI